MHGASAWPVLRGLRGGDRQRTLSSVAIGIEADADYVLLARAGSAAAARRRNQHGRGGRNQRPLRSLGPCPHPGVYEGTLTVSSAEATKRPRGNVHARMRVKLRSALAVGTNALSWSLLQGETGAQYLQVGNAGGLTLNYFVAMDVPWAAASPPYGASTGEMDIVRVFVNTAGLNAGSYHGTLCVVNHEATGEQARVALDLVRAAAARRGRRAGATRGWRPGRAATPRPRSASGGMPVPASRCPIA